VRESIGIVVVGGEGAVVAETASWMAVELWVRLQFGTPYPWGAVASLHSSAQSLAATHSSAGNVLGNFPL
jgi:hypothetical protein